MTTATATLRERVADAYFAEAERLDAADVAGWAQWLHPEFRYEVPMPVVHSDPAAPHHSSTGLLAVETRASIELWQRRVSDDLIDSAYAENPPARARHFVTNIRVSGPDADGNVAVVSNVLLSWSEWNQPPQFVTAERHDGLDGSGERLLLRSRRVLLDSAIVRLTHLRIVI